MAITVSNATSTLALPSSTTAYTAGQQVGAVGSFAWPSATAGALQRLRLSTNDTTTTSWGGVIVQVDIWSSSPTMGGDRAAYSVTSGAATHLGAFVGTFSAVGGDGAYAELAPVPIAPLLNLSSGQTVYYTIQAIGASGVTGASKVMSLVAEVLY